MNRTLLIIFLIVASFLSGFSLGVSSIATYVSKSCDFPGEFELSSHKFTCAAKE